MTKELINNDNITFGRVEGLQFILRWTDSLKCSTAGDASLGRLSIKIKDTFIWGSQDSGVEWAWIELLEHFEQIWTYLLFENLDPFGFGDTNPKTIYKKAMLRWENLREEERTREEQRLLAFNRTHDFSQGLGGIWLPSIFFLRRGDNAIITTNDKEYVLPLVNTINTLEQLGEAILERINKLAPNDSRSETIRGLWSERQPL